MSERVREDRHLLIDRELAVIALASDEQRRLRRQILGHVRSADRRLGSVRTTLTEEWRRTREGLSAQGKL